MVPKMVFWGMWTPKHHLLSTIPQKGLGVKPRVLSHKCFRSFHVVICSLGEMKEFVWLIVCVSKKTQTSSIPLAKLGEPILLGFCTAIQLTPWRNHIFWAAFEYLYPFCIYGGSNFPFFHILLSWLLTQHIALPFIRVIITLYKWIFG